MKLDLGVTRNSSALAMAMLLIMAGLALTSMRGDWAIIDEVAHLPAGYAYVTRGDMRLNPEHPPLAKDLAGLAVLAWSKISGAKINFPDQLAAWRNNTNDQWTFGRAFLFYSHNDYEAMLFWGRVPIWLALVLFGWLLFAWSRQRYGPVAALLVLFLYVFSPTFIAHGRLVTTDLLAAVGFFASFITFMKWLERPSKKNLLVAGLVLGAAELVKFSLLLLAPVFAVLVILYCLVAVEQPNWWLSFSSLADKRIIGYVFMLLIAFGAVVMPVYLAHTIGYPAQKQHADTIEYFNEIGTSKTGQVAIWLSAKPVWRAAAQYISGVELVQNRSHWGSTTYFLGEVSNSGRRWYFPVVYFFKEPVTLHILTLVALAAAAIFLWHERRRWRSIFKKNFVELGFIFFIAAYWHVSLNSQLNIGVRHVLPTFPFIYILVAASTVAAVRRVARRKVKIAVIGSLGILLAWQAISVVRVHPSYLAYYNELIGGPEGGQKIAADSNLDWGQDLKRLAEFVQDRGITKIAVDYFGPGSPSLVMPSQAREYHVEFGPVTGWIAISQTYLTLERGRPATGMYKAINRYAWLDSYEPVASIGHSIVVYHIPEK